MKEIQRREAFMAAKIQEASKFHNKVLFVGGLAHIPRILEKLESPQAFPLMKTGIKAALTAPIHPDSLKKGFTEIPKITETFENWRSNPENPPPENRHDMIISLMRASADYFVRETKQEIPEYVRITWAKFLRKWLSYKGELLPDLTILCLAPALPWMRILPTTCTNIFLITNGQMILWIRPQ